MGRRRTYVPIGYAIDTMENGPSNSSEPRHHHSPRNYLDRDVATKGALTNVTREAIPFVLLFVGAALLLYGGLPVWHAIFVWNRIMQQSSVELHEMDDWDQWAFAPRFVISAAVGALLLAMGAISIFQTNSWPKIWAMLKQMNNK